MAKGIDIKTNEGRRVVEGTGYYAPRTVNDLRELVKGSAASYGDAIGFKFKDKEGNITGKTYTQFDSDIDCLGTALMSLGLAGKRIAIISENRYDWGVCYFSVVNGTGIVVPLDKYLPKIEVENLIKRSSAEAIFYSSQYAEMMSQIASAESHLKYFFCMDDVDGEREKPGNFHTMRELIATGKALLASGDRTFVDAPIDREKMSILLFTSGTTSMAKGVMLSHANIAANVTAITSVIKIGPGDTHLSLLPLHHTFENSIGLMLMVHCGSCIAYCDGIKYIAQNLIEYKVTLLVVVPAILEAIHSKMKEGIEKSGKAGLLAAITKVSQFLRLVKIDLRRKLFHSVLEKLGPNLRLAVSGAAPLDPAIVTAFDHIGLRVLQGYGLTETSPVIAAENDFVGRLGTVGYPLEGIEVAIDSPDENGMGEIITRGKNVMLGYFEDEKGTAEVLESNGWFHTGDLGMIDKDGFLKITGRAKSMIVFTNGKKAFPEEYEMLLNIIPGVKDSYVWGNKAADGDIQICAKLVIDEDKISAAEAPEAFEKAIREINKNIPTYKIIRYFVISHSELQKTTTLKIKRPQEYAGIKTWLEAQASDMRKASGRFID